MLMELKFWIAVMWGWYEISRLQSQVNAQRGKAFRTGGSLDVLVLISASLTLKRPVLLSRMRKQHLSVTA
jgi:hypothetical protein